MARAKLNQRRGTSHLKNRWNPLATFFWCVLATPVLVLAFVGLATLEQRGAEDAVETTTQMLNHEIVEPLDKVFQFQHPAANAEGLLVRRPAEPIKIGYAISLIKCGDKQSNRAGLVDAAIVLRHSVHENSVRNNQKSAYDYQMYAFVHTNAVPCSEPLKEAGFKVIVKDTPVHPNDIQGEYLRKHVKKEWCCGHDEFIKLYAYQLTEVPVVVHVDMDYIFAKPMDDVYDAMLYSKTSEIGRVARSRVPVEFPNEVRWPDNVEAFMTRDWPQVIPGRKAGYQAGFMVVKPNPKIFDLVMDVIRKGDYVEGYGRDNGWGGQGYGGFVGAMAMQGLMAYVYDAILVNTWVELNQCRFNHIGMDVLFRAAPGFRKNHEKAGKCRNDRETCEDCMTTPVDQIYNIHYNQCRKPWNCIGEGSHGGEKYGKETIPEDQVHLDHCMEVMTVWHNYRTDLEQKMLALTSDKTIEDGRKGSYKTDIFQGHCTGNGGKKYLPLAGKTGTFQKISDLYAKIE